MNKIIVTGYKGFIGKRLYDKLLEDKNNIILGIDESYFEYHNWTSFLKKTLDNFLPDVIFHVGACSDTMLKDENYMMTRNYESTKIIVNRSKIYDIPLIYSSSAANYGINNEYPSNLYGWSKYAGEDYVHLHNGVSLRYFNVYGPGEENKGKMASIAYQMFNKYKKGEEVKIFPGNPRRDFVYVDDVVRANIHAYKNYQQINNKKYFEVGSGESGTFEDVMRLLEIPFTYHDKNMIPEGYQFDTKSDKFYWIPGWKPEFTLEDGLTEYKKYLNNNFVDK